MGTYINIGDAGFQRARNSEYVDKSGLIAVVNQTINTEQSFSCVSRCRRFGKSMAAMMLAAYYDRSCNSRSLFADLKIANDPSFDDYLNKYSVIYLDMTAFVTRYHDEHIIDYIECELKKEVLTAFPDVMIDETADLMDALIRINEATSEQFVFIIDEWDAICREFKPGTQAMSRYVSWLRRMFKDVSGKKVFALVYMTGILPIKKYKTESALNNFCEYSMISPGNMAQFFGFTIEETKVLAAKYNVDFDELEKWYDGYQIGSQMSMFNPNSVIQALRNQWCESYWGKTGAADAVAAYIKMNFEGLRDNVILMLAGGRCKVDPKGFKNDISEIYSRDDALTLLIHLGYLSYDRMKHECFIPNLEVSGEMELAIRTNSWQPVVAALQASEHLLQATLNGDEEAVAHGVEMAHDAHTSILSYNDENSLACVLSIAYYYARNDYVMHRELATGKGFADIVLIPRKNVVSPAILLELKVNRDADTAINQIYRKQYPAKIVEYADRLLLVGINYDRDTKRHTCRIETYKP